MFDKNAREKNRTFPRTDAESCPQHCVAYSSFCISLSISLNIFKLKTPPKARSGGSQQQKEDAHFPAAQSRPHPSLSHSAGLVLGTPCSTEVDQESRGAASTGCPSKASSGSELLQAAGSGCSSPSVTARPSTVLIPCNIYGAFLSSSSEASANTAWQRRAARKEGVPRGSYTRTRTNHNITRLNNTVKNI